MDEQQIRIIIKEVVHETLEGLGLDTKNLKETQKDMVYLNRLRTGSEDLYGKARLVFITTVIPAAIYLLWDAIKSKIKNG